MLAYLYLALAQLTVSFNIVTSKYLVLHMSSFVVLQLRFIFATLAIAIVALIAEPKHNPKILLKWPISHRLNFIIQALCAGLFFNLFLLAGLKHTSAGSAGIITSFLPSMIVLFSVFFLHEILNLQKLISLALATIGLLLVNLKSFLTSTGVSHVWGDFLVFIALFPEAAFYIMLKNCKYDISPLWIAVYMNLINLIAFLPLTIFKFHQGFSDITTFDLLLNISIGLSTGLFYIFWYKGAEKIEASVASLFTAVMPVGTLILAAIFLKEFISPLQIAGLVLIVSAIIMGSVKFNDLKRA